MLCIFFVFIFFVCCCNCCFVLWSCSGACTTRWWRRQKRVLRYNKRGGCIHRKNHCFGHLFRFTFATVSRRSAFSKRWKWCTRQIMADSMHLFIDVNFVMCREWWGQKPANVLIIWPLLEQHSASISSRRTCAWIRFSFGRRWQFLFMAILFFFILLCFVWYSYAFGVHIELCTKTSHLQFVVVWWLAFCALLHIHLWCSSRSLLPRVAARRHRRRRRRYCCCCIDDVLLFRTDEFVFKFLSRRMNAVILRYALCASQQFRMLVHGAVFCPHSSQMAYCVTNVAMIAFALLFFFYSSCRSIFLDDAMRSI